MKKLLILFLCSFVLFANQSCSNEDDSGTRKVQREISVYTVNATITSILIKSGNDILFKSSNLNEGNYDLKIADRNNIYIEATAIVKANDKAIIAYGEIVGGDAIYTIKKIEKEDVQKGDELKISGTITFNQE